MTNIQILQQSVLLKYKDLYRFLLEHAPDVARDRLRLPALGFALLAVVCGPPGLAAGVRTLSLRVGNHVQ